MTSRPKTIAMVLALGLAGLGLASCASDAAPVKSDTGLTYSYYDPYYGYDYDYYDYNDWPYFGLGWWGGHRNFGHFGHRGFGGFHGGFHGGHFGGHHR